MGSRVAKYSLYSMPLITGYAGYRFYDKRQKVLADPIAINALQVLKSDKRVLDFCGENLKPGWKVSRKEDTKEGTVTFNFNVSGGSGKLKTTVVADYALHGSLKIFNQELEEHHQKKATDPKYDANEFEENWPIDLEEYTMVESDSQNLDNKELMERHMKKEILDDQKIWRIKNLRVAVDDDVRILLLPLPESKRTKKLIDTRYNFVTFGDIIKLSQEKLEKFDTEIKEVKRFEDKTQEEINEDIKHKRRKQFQTMTTIRKYQFGIIMFIVLIYLFVWKRVAPKPVLNSLVYYNAIEIMKKSSVVKRKLGENFQITNCTGRIYPLMSHVNFEMTALGNVDQAKFKIKSTFKQEDEIWMIEDIAMLTKSDLK